MAELTKEQQRALALARARARSRQREMASQDNQAPAPTQTPQAGRDGYTGAILPFRRDAETGNISLAVPTVVQAIASALRLPGDVATGQTPVRDQTGNINPDVIRRSFDLAAVASPMTPPMRNAATLPSAIQARPLREGQRVAVAAQRAGVDMPRGATSDAMIVQQAARMNANVPSGGVPLRQASERAIGQLDDAARRVQRNLGGGDRAAAGAGVRADVENTVRNTFAARVGRRYEAVDELVRPDVTRPLRATKTVVDDIMGRRGQAGLPGEGQAVRQVREAVARREGLTYQGVKDLRTSIGEMMDNLSLAPQGMSQGELRRIYGALTDDLRATVERAGGRRALGAFNEANRFAEIIARERKALNNILRVQSDEAVTDRLVALAGQTSRANMRDLRRVKSAVTEDTWRELGSAVISRMGRDADDAFSPRRFLTAYGKLSPAGKRALFDDATAQALDDLATVSRRFRQLDEFANPSGTGQQVMFAGAGAGLVTEPITTLSALGGSYLLSRLLAKPTSARQVAAWAKAMERSVFSPSAAAQRALVERSQPLAITMAREAGAPSLAAQFAPRLEGVVKPAANENGGQQPPAQERPRYNPETDL